MRLVIKDLSKFKSKDLVPVICEQCNKEFSKPKSEIMRAIKGSRAVRFCSLICAGKFKTVKLSIASSCQQCGKETKKKKSALRKNSFCSKSCAATYNNHNKTTGTRRSKLEIYIEQQLHLDFPELTLHCNEKTAIQSELDFYFPQLKLAIELNGIFHYEPIYGTDKLERIQNNDQQKLIKCYEQGIELCIIDTSSCKYLTQKERDKYYAIVKNLINSVINRAKPLNTSPSQ